MTAARILIEYPWLSLIPAAVLALLWRRSRSRTALVGAALWIAYMAWEIAVRESSPDANIRIDLLAIYPVLVVLTVLGVWFGARMRAK